MTYLRSLVSAILLLPAVLSAIEPVPLFDGRSLDGWEGNAAQWRVEEGAITGEIPASGKLDHNEFLFWKGEVADFDLTLEYRITGGPSANSGIQFRSERRADGSARGYQADLDDGAVWLGRIYDEEKRGLLMERGSRGSIAPDDRRWSDPFAPPESFRSVPKKDGWNRYRILATGSHMALWINDVFFGALDDHQADAAEYAGRIGIQLHAGDGPAKIQVRNVRLISLGKTALPAKDPKVVPIKDANPDAITVVGSDGKSLNLDFEKGTLEGGTAEGDAWKDQPIKGDTVNQRKPSEASQHAGTWWIGGFERVGDGGTGTLTSVPFTVSQPWASFLIGGGNDVATERVELVVADTGKVFHTATGRNVENMSREVVDMRPVQGQRLFIRLVDAGKGPWGHLNFDNFVFHKEPPAQVVTVGGADRQNTSPVLWHLRPNPAKPTVVANPDAQKTVEGMMLTPGFQAELIAAEPDVRQPEAFAMDEKGRLWILEAYSYPNKQPEGKGKDRIIILEDKDGDGIFETRKVFMEGLNLASAIEVGFGGVWIGAAPQLLFIPDRNHDDIPDGPPEVLLDGWGYQDTHETLNSFTWGPDGWLYGNQGVFTKSAVGKPGAPDDQRISFNSGVWRYHPIRHEFEIFAHGGSNQWGLDYNEAGHLFMTHCRSFYGGGGTTYVIRNGHFWNQSNSNYAPFISNAGPDFAPDVKNFLPAAAKYDSGEGGAGKPGTTAIYGGHSHVGTMIYQGENWPVIYRDHLFTHNLHGHQMNQQVNVREGSAYETMHAGADLMYTPDPRYIAVDLQTGPDGAVYVIDWYDQQHCHSPVEEKWDRTNGRVYRISWAATYRPVKVDLSTKSNVELAKLQTDRNDWMGRTARRLLMARAAEKPLDAETIGVLRGFAASADWWTALRGLWTLHQTGNLNAEILTAALHHESDLVRSWAVQLATDYAKPPLLPLASLLALAKDDPSPTVRLALASALPTLPSPAIWDVGAALANHAEDATDRFLPKMIWSGLAPAVAADFPRALAVAEETKLQPLADSIRWYAATSAPGREALLGSLAKLPDATADRAIRLTSFALRSESSLPSPVAWVQTRERVAKSNDATVHADADQLSAVFGNRDVLDRMRQTLADTSAPAAARQTAFDLLKRTGDPSALPIFAKLLDEPAYRSAVIPLLSRSNEPATAAALLQRFTSLTPADQTATLATLSSRPALALALLQATQAGTLDKKLLTSLHIRQIRNLNDATCNQLLEKTWGKFNETPAAMKETIARIKHVYNEAPLWAYEEGKGRAVFERVCTTCHAMGGNAAAKVGPDLAGSWRNGIDYFVENIVDPNAVVGDAFQMTIVTLKDGTALSGVLDNETATTLTLRTITGPASVPLKEIKERQKLEQSLMPPGLLEALPEREMIELLKFLTSKS